MHLFWRDLRYLLNPVDSILIAMGYRNMCLLKLSSGSWENIQSTNPNNIGKIEQWFRGVTTGSENIDFDDMTEVFPCGSRNWFSHDVFLLQSLKQA